MNKILSAFKSQLSMVPMQIPSKLNDTFIEIRKRETELKTIIQNIKVILHKARY